MSSKASPAFTSAVHPPVGTLIDGGALELVELLGVGGYGVVYRAVDTRQRLGARSYAVKCLLATGHYSSRQKQVHIREITLHQLASAHPGVVSLHRVVEQYNCTFIIMDFAPDHDLFTQILHSCRYLGDDALIKDVFLQLLDAVEYCHSLHIYHRDLKPENILCYEDGLRVAITDFGLATTAELSDEFRTGSVYHMSPECQGGEFAPTGHYSPKFNDVWSLGIILLNLATGRNPWKSATPNDPTFQAYLRDPYGFLPSVLPISAEANDILVRMLHVDWRERATLREVRYAIEEISTFYSDGAIFEGSMARCPWESSMDIDSASDTTNPDDVAAVNAQAEPSLQATSPILPSPATDGTSHIHHLGSELGITSRWSQDSSSDVISAGSLAQDSSYGDPHWTVRSSSGATWEFESPVTSTSDQARPKMFSNLEDLPSATRSTSSTHTSPSSAPATPNSMDLAFGSKADPPAVVRDARRLVINTHDLPNPRIYDATAFTPSMEDRRGNEEDDDAMTMMHTAIEYDPHSSMFFLNSPIVSPARAKGKGAESNVFVVPPSGLPSPREQRPQGTQRRPEPVVEQSFDKEMVSPSTWAASDSNYSASSAASSAFTPVNHRGIGHHPNLIGDLVFKNSLPGTPDLYLSDDEADLSDYFGRDRIERAKRQDRIDRRARTRAASNPVWLNSESFFRHQPDRFRLEDGTSLEAEREHTSQPSPVSPMPRGSMTNDILHSSQAGPGVGDSGRSRPVGGGSEASSPVSVASTQRPVGHAGLFQLGPLAGKDAPLRSTPQPPKQPQQRRPSNPGMLIAKLAGKLFSPVSSPSPSSNPAGRSPTSTPTTPKPTAKDAGLVQATSSRHPAAKSSTASQSILGKSLVQTPPSSPTPPGLFFAMSASCSSGSQSIGASYRPYITRTQVPKPGLCPECYPDGHAEYARYSVVPAPQRRLTAGDAERPSTATGVGRGAGKQLQRATKNWFLPGRFKAVGTPVMT